MKLKIGFIAILLIGIAIFLLTPKRSLAQNSEINFQVFYDELSPYGEWVEYQDYGYVWIPDAGSDFVPYSTEGHWIMTDYGWTWVSDYNWGWAPFHYGRWGYDNYYGWLWVPDEEWGPSWVTWRRAEGYYGWAPMEPGMSVAVSFGREYDRHNDHWVFVRDRDIERSNIHHYHVDRTVHNRIIVQSTVINTTYIDNSRHTTYISGPARADVQKATGRRINTVAVRENSKPGQQVSNGQLRIYRPEVKKNSGGDRKPVPSRIGNLKDVKPPSERLKKGNPGQVKPRRAEQNRQPGNVNQQKNGNRVKPSQPANTNPSENKNQKRQPKAVKPGNNNVKPSQPSNTNPSGNERKLRQPARVKPENNKNNTEPQQPGQVNPSENRRQNQEPQTVKPQNRRNTEEPSQPGKASPTENRRQYRQSNTVNPNNNQVKPDQSGSVKPTDNNVQNQQPAAVKQAKSKSNKEPGKPRTGKRERRK